MNWEAAGAIGEIVGAIAVVATLGYLAVQIRHSNVVAREQAHYHMLQNQLGYFDKLAENIDFVRTVHGRDLTDDQIAFYQHEAHVISTLFKWNWEYMRRQDGVYDVSILPIQGWRTHYYPVGIDRHWERVKLWHDPGFVQFMESEIIPHAIE